MSEPSYSQSNSSPAVGPSAAPPTIHLSVEEYQRLRAFEQQLDEVRKAQQVAIDAKEAERLRALAEKGQIEEALAQQRKSWEQKHAEATARYTQLEQQVHAERKAAVIAESFEGRSFIGETAEQRAATAIMVRRLLQEEFDSTRDASGALVVREKVSGRPAIEVLRERLDSPQFAIFFAPSSRGGSGTDGTRPPANPQSSQPGTLDAIVADWRNRQNQYQSFGLRSRS
ncbi:hypothetical protein [Aquisphaera insulae]|uniref:hypothetical protein n=1 Tax=Aquisphaera insulae TaxID=2712864 RepID=UPI0013ECE554|nr:hypothetical protein [Aquisphaera insulae]